jgi:rhomboid protease GluP
MGINIIIFFLMTVEPNEELFFKYGALQGGLVVVYGEQWRLFTSMFLHGGGTHIVMNMLSLYIVGRLVERLFSASGYLWIYLLSGLIGSLNSIYFHPMGWGVGASGAIFGIFGALTGFVLVHKERMQSEFMEFMSNFGLILLINFVIGIVFPSIDMSAHIGGLLAGLVGGVIVARNYKNLWLFVILMLILSAVIYSYLPSLYIGVE